MQHTDRAGKTETQKMERRERGAEMEKTWGEKGEREQRRDEHG